MTVSEPEIAFIGAMLVLLAAFLTILVGMIKSPFGLIGVQEERTRLLWTAECGRNRVVAPLFDENLCFPHTSNRTPP